MLDRTDAIADDVALQLLAHEPSYAHGGGEMHAELRASCREHIARGVRTMAGLAEPGEEAVHVWRETGRRRAQQGIPMDVVLRAYSFGSRALWEGLLERCREADLGIDEHMLLLAGRMLWRSMDVQTATLVEAYRREHARLQLRDLQRQHSLLDGLVEGRAADPAFAQDVCAALGIASDEPLVCVVALVDDPLVEPLSAPEDRLERGGIVSHWHVHAGNQFGVVTAAGHSMDELVRLVEPAVTGRAGLAPAPEGLPGFPLAYRLATRTAATLPEGSRGLATVQDRLPEVLVTASPELVPPLLHETLGPLLTLPGPQSRLMLDTLVALLAHDGSPTHAARQLYCHRNTVLYRLHQIESLTGRTLNNPRDKLLLSLGVLATGRTF
ncbi:MAG TPA: helix-turn-helix domain-containing protein [Nocardioidaceae bacterium]|nr:helix-turn-helix domain-containing protein [Nocardioidaceae bacterium]